jgi:hypothetical protein
LVRKIAIFVYHLPVAESTYKSNLIAGKASPAVLPSFAPPLRRIAHTPQLSLLGALHLMLAGDQEYPRTV